MQSSALFYSEQMAQTPQQPLAEQTRGLLAAGQRVTLTGVAGSGKSVLLRMAAEGRAPVYWLRPNAADRSVPFCALADLLLQLDTAVNGQLPAPQREALEVVLGRRHGTPHPLLLRLAMAELLRSSTVVIDDAHFLDDGSRDIFGYVIRHGGPSFALLASAQAGELPLPETTQLPVPPLDAEAVASLLESQGMPGRLAGKIHLASGGIPGLALAIGGAAVAEVDVATFDANAVTPPVTTLVRRLLSPLDASQRTTLLLAALADQPTLPLLRRAGRATALQDITAAREAGIAAITDDGRICLAPSVVARVLVFDAAGAELAACHAALAQAAEDEAGRLWHAIAVRTVPDAETADLLGKASVLALAAGRTERAAELALRAASLATPEVPAAAIAQWLVSAAGAAGAAGRPDLARSALDYLESSGACASDRARARLAVADAAGQALGGLDEMLSRALVEAQGNDRLVAAVQLRLAWRANLAEGSPQRACQAAMQAAQHARAAGDGPTEALALTMLARMQRLLGNAEAGHTLATALTLPQTPSAYGLHNSPHYLALRHAFFDDRLEETRQGLLAMLPVAEESGIAEDLVDLLRFLSEVEVRAGHCQTALSHAVRGIRLSEQAGLSPGPSFYTAAIAELAAGTPEQARHYAMRSLRASQDERDQVYLARGWYASGLISLAVRDAGAAVQELRRVQTLEQMQQVHDPSILRWHGELAEALAGAGDLTEASRLINATRGIAAHLDRGGVIAALDRAEGIYHCATGDPDQAVTFLQQAQERFAQLGMPLERGRCFVALAATERRRRRPAAVRIAQQQAQELFTTAGAPSWAAAAQITSRRSRRPDTAPVTLSLTEAEARITEMVCAGAANREIANTLFLSVKTVEATLTRIYRRAGVRSRAQLQTALRR